MSPDLRQIITAIAGDKRPGNSASFMGLRAQEPVDTLPPVPSLPGLFVLF
jgi:hypothetical protein